MAAMQINMDRIQSLLMASFQRFPMDCPPLKTIMITGRTSQVLFFKFKSSETSLKHYSGKVTINTHVLANVRDLIKTKIAAHAMDYIKALPDLS